MKIEENLKAAIVIAIIVAVVGMAPIASASDWGQFQKDNINSGYTTDIAPISDPELAWSKYTNSGTEMGSGIDVAPIVADGAVYVLDCKGILWSFDAITGAENWYTNCVAGTGGGFEVSTPAYHDGIVYAAVSSGSEGQGAGRVCAVYAINGTIREWDYYGLDTFQLNTPITYADGKIYVGNSKGATKDISTYYCIDASNVTNEIWNRTTLYATGYYWAGAAIVGDYIIYGDDTANVTCLNKDTGAFVDYINVSEACGVTPVEEIRSSIVWNEATGRIYFTGKKPSPRSGHAYAVSFNAATGDIGNSCDWVTDIDYSTSTPVVYGDRVYVCMGGMYGGDGKVLKCLDEASGNILYTYDIPNGASQASPAVSVADGHVYIYFTTNMDNGSAYCIEDTGSALVERWEWNPPEDNQFILQGMAISDGMVYFGTDYGRVYALAEPHGLCGDVNRDGYVNGVDVGLLIQKVYNPPPPSAFVNEWAGNVYCDTYVNGVDVGLLLQKVYNPPPPSTFECCKDC